MDSLQTKIKECLPKEKKTISNWSTSDIRMLSSTDIEMEKNKGFNQALLDVHSSIPKLIEIVKEEMKKTVLECCPKNGYMSKELVIDCIEWDRKE